jgi:predicted RNA-binding protein YlqC (UPF0109 family)
VNCEEDRTSANTGVATATDNCDREIDFTESDSVAEGTCPQEEVITRTWVGTDDCGNASRCNQIVSVVDDENPAITCPDDVTVNCEEDRTSKATGVATATDNCDREIDIVESDSVADGTCPQEEVITRTWVGTDDCGNASRCNQIVSVVDIEPPVITCPADVTVNCEDDRTSANTGAAKATDNCDREIDIIESDSVAAGSCPQEEVITRTWTGTDDCGNASSCNQIVAVVDDENPAITCPDDVTVNCEDDRTSKATGVATATDNCDREIDIVESDSVADGTCPQEEVITRTWVGTDDCGNASRCNQIVSVVDIEPPVITCPADVTVNCEDDRTSANTGAATATDNCDREIDIIESDSVAEGTCPQEEVITRTWTGTDDCGNASSCNQIVAVVDDENPAITCPDDVTVNCEEDRTSANTGVATATDNCDREIDIVESDSVADGTCPQEEVITRTWTGTDDCGNASRCTQTVTVVDDEVPAITCPADVTVNCEDDRSSASTGAATATDNCDDDVTITESDSVAAGSCPQEEVITRTWTGTDDCGNASRCAQTVSVVDDENPVITCPDDVTVNCEDDRTSASTGVATATDNCDREIDIVESDSVAEGACPQEEVITRTWVGTDDCGNASRCNQIVSVVDIEPPVITCPDDVTVNCEEDRTSANTGVATATDNCDEMIDIVESDSVAAGSCRQEEVITRMWVGTDDCGNASRCEQIVTVIDDEAPAITCPILFTTVNCQNDSSSDSTGVATATDNCDTDVTITESDSVAAGSCPQEEVIKRTWTGTDDCGNASRCIQTITVVDDEAPAITCPADTTVNCEDDSSSASTGGPTATDNCDRKIDFAESDSVAAGSCPQEEVTTRKWTGTDDCGNASSCAQTVTVIDNEAPAITCPADVSVNCEDDRNSAATGEATATDNCDDQVVIGESDSIAAGSCPQEEVITRTWTGTDDCGNSSRCDQVVTVVDTTPPEIQCNAYDITEFDGDDDDDDDDDDSVSFTATATDLCSDVRIKVGWIVCVPPPGDDDDDDDDCKVRARGATITVLNSGDPGTVINWTAKATDDCGNIVAVNCSVTVLEGEKEEEDDDDDHHHHHDKPWWWHWRHW